MPPPSQRHRHLDGLRALAASWVTLFHFSEANPMPHLQAGLPEWIWLAVFKSGYLGVPVFFVLSGMVAALNLERVTVDARQAGQYLVRRLIRLTPPYYAAIAIAVLAAGIKSVALGEDVRAIDAAQVAAHLAYAQLIVGAEPLSVVFWTLCIEVQFYVSIALLYALADHAPASAGRPARRRVAVLLAAGLFAFAWPLGWIRTPVWPGACLPLWSTFLAGALLGATVGRDRMRPIATVFGVLLLAIGLLRHDPFSATAGVVAVTLATMSESGWLARGLTARPLVWAGGISYSLYLMHNPAIAAVSRLMQRLSSGGALAEIVLLVTGLALCLIAAALLHRTVEQPAIAWSRRTRAPAGGLQPA